ncbi:hypothetical protein [Streptomyces exfoliatus]|uniref:hypothetical protein n=1 Tax=Streptomyces exfoliatus TaxID=1905 RepID=UPI0037B8CBE6
MTEATAKKAALRKAPAKTDRLVAVLAEVRRTARAIGDLPAELIGGHFPERAVENYRKRGEDWHLINRRREIDERLGMDGLAVQVTFAAFGGRDRAEIREGLVRLASLAVAAVEWIDREAE